MNVITLQMKILTLFLLQRLIMLPPPFQSSFSKQWRFCADFISSGNCWFRIARSAHSDFFVSFLIGIIRAFRFPIKSTGKFPLRWYRNLPYFKFKIAGPKVSCIEVLQLFPDEDSPLTRSKTK
jgi:hypothetical protein